MIKNKIIVIYLILNMQFLFVVYIFFILHIVSKIIIKNAIGSEL